MNKAHKLAISKSKQGKKHSDITKKVMSASRLKYIANKNENWVLISPTNEIKRTKSLKAFCAELQLSYSALRKKAISNDGRAVERGPSRGWAIYGKSKT